MCVPVRVRVHVTFHTILLTLKATLVDIVNVIQQGMAAMRPLARSLLHQVVLLLLTGG